jgi:hypothetical protein
MATDKNQIHLKPLKEICKNIETQKDITKHVAELQKLLDKHAFYQQHGFIELLEILTRSLKLEKKNKTEIYKLLDQLLREGSDTKDWFIARLYKFILEQRVGR